MFLRILNMFKIGGVGGELFRSCYVCEELDMEVWRCVNLFHSVLQKCLCDFLYLHGDKKDVKNVPRCAGLLMCIHMFKAINI